MVVIKSVRVYVKNILLKAHNKKHLKGKNKQITYTQLADIQQSSFTLKTVYANIYDATKLEHN